MTYYDIGIIPDEADLSGVRGRLSPGNAPAIEVAKHVTLLFGSQPEDHEFAIRYLTKLWNEALRLAQQLSEVE